MLEEEKRKINKWFIGLANRSAAFIGNPYVFLLAFLLIVIWILLGFSLHFNTSWQILINTITTIITFLAVFLVQNVQNRDDQAMKEKLDRILDILEDKA